MEIFYILMFDNINTFVMFESLIGHDAIYYRTTTMDYSKARLGPLFF